MEKVCRWCGAHFTVTGKASHRLYCQPKCKYAMKNALYRQPDRRLKRERKRTKTENAQSVVLRSVRENREKDIIRDIKYLVVQIDKYIQELEA